MVLWYLGDKALVGKIEDLDEDPEIRGLREPLPTGIVCSGEPLNTDAIIICEDSESIMPIIAFSRGCPMCLYHKHHNGYKKRYLDEDVLKMLIVYKDYEFTEIVNGF